MKTGARDFNTWTFQIKRQLCEFAFLTSIYIIFEKSYSNRYLYELILDNYYITESRTMDV